MNPRTLSGMFWILLACLLSCFNDVMCKSLGGHLHAINVLFFRFLFSTLLFLPWVITQRKTFYTKHLGIHALRGLLFSCAMLPWCYGIIALPLPLITTISFAVPLFVTLLAQIFLRESVGFRRMGAVVIGFIGVMVGSGAYYTGEHGLFVGLALLATFMFAVLDVVNKKLLILHEGFAPMMFFSSLWTMLFTFPLAWMHWQTPNTTELGWLILLGIGANGLLGCLLKASSCCDLSALQPLRYTEFIFSCVFSILIFHEQPTFQVLCGLAFIVPTTLYLGHHELRLEKNKLQSL